MTAHTDESWAAHRQDRARYDAVHAQLAQIEEGMDSVTNPQARELLEMLHSLLRDLLGICESSEAQECADETIQACDVCGLVDHHCRGGACPACNRKIQEVQG